MHKVSIIIPSYNHSRYVSTAIDSVLSQDYEHKELIVVDDGSTDGSPELLRSLAEKHGFKLILKQNEGVCATLNRGLELVTGDLITFIASDDIMPAARLRSQVEVMIANPDFDVAAGKMEVIDEDGRIISKKSLRAKGLISFDQMISRNVVYAPTAIFRGNFFKKFGLYNPAYAFEDYYMWLRVLMAGGKIFNTPKVWALYRINTGNLDRRFRWYFRGYQQTLSDYLPDPRAKRSLEHYRLIYCAKMTLLHGRKFISEEKATFDDLTLFHRAVLRVAAFVPAPLRVGTLNFLLREL